MAVAMGQSAERAILPAAPGWDVLRLAGRAASGIEGRAPSGPALERAARDFEAVFVRMMLETMLQGESDSFFGAGPSAGVVRNLFLDQVGSAVAGRKAFGIASLVEKSMARWQPQPSAGEKPASGPEATSESETNRAEVETNSWRG